MSRTQLFFSSFALGLASIFWAPPLAAQPGFYTVVPCRVYDSRQIGAPLTSNVERTVTIAGQCGVPPNAMAVASNITTVAATDAGTLSAYPGPGQPTGTFVQGFPANGTRAGMAVLGLNREGSGGLTFLALSNGPSAVQLDLVVDISGYFLGTGAFDPWWFPEIAPRRIGVVNALHDYWYESNLTATNDLASLGFHAIKLWPTESYHSPDLLAIYRNPAFDVIVLRPLQNSPMPLETGCNGQQYFRWENIDYGAVARNLYSLVGDVQKTIILTGWEADWQIKGLGCTQVPTQAEQDSFLALLNARQAGVAAARVANLDKKLRIYHAVEVNNIANTNFDVIDQIVPRMANPPDLIAYSYWSATFTISQVLNYIKSVAPLPNHRIFIGEVGREERPSVSQYPYLYASYSEAYNWGARLVFMWNYRAQFGCPKDHGTWLRRCDNSLATSYGALKDLQTAFEQFP